MCRPLPPSDDAAYLLSENGVRQGDPLSSMLFSLAMRSVYSHIAAQLQSGSILSSTTPRRGLPVAVLEAQLPGLLPLGLQLNVGKCE